MAVGIGIELGPSAVRAVVVEGATRGAAGQGTLRAAQELPCDTSNPHALAQALTQLRRALRISQPVVLGLPSTSAILTTVTPLIANPRRTQLAVAFELQQLLPFDLADAAWHYRWLFPTNGQATPASRRQGKPGRRNPEPATSIPHSNAAVAAAMRRSLLEERLAACRRAGLAVQAVAVNPIATLNAAHLQSGEASWRPVALLNVIDPQTAEWIVHTATQLAVVPIANLSPQAPGAAGAAGSEPFLQELAASWEGLRLQCHDLPNQVWLLGAAATADAVTARLRLDVKRFDLARAVTVGSAVPQPEQWAAALGLALQGLGAAPMALNLLSAVQSQGVSHQRQRAAAVACGVLALVATLLGLSGMMEVRQRRARLLEALERRERLYQSLRPEVLALLRQQEHIERRSAQLEQLVANRTLLSQMLASVSAALPARTWLTKFDCSKDGLLEGVIEGRATTFQDVTQLFDRLKTDVGMTTVKPLATSVITDAATNKEVVVFSVQVQRQTAASSAVAVEDAPTKQPEAAKRAKSKAAGRKSKTKESP